MITGSLLLPHNKRITIDECVLKYSKRQLLAVLLFGTFYAAMMEVSSNGISSLIIIKSILGSITGSTFSHLWYCFLLIGIYLILPVLKVFINKADNKEILYLLMVLFLFDFCVPFVNVLFDEKIQFGIPFTYALFYLICGYYIIQINTKISVYTYDIMACVTLTIIIMLVYYNPVIDLRYLNNNSPIVALLAISMFGLFQKLANEKQREILWKIDYALEFT